MEVLHFIFLVCVCPIYFIRISTQIIRWRIGMLNFAHNLLWRVVSWLSVFISREHPCKSVSHLQFTIEGSSEECLIWVKRTIAHGMSCSRGQIVVWILIAQSRLKELSFTSKW